MHFTGMLFLLSEGGAPCHPGQDIVCTVGACSSSIPASKTSATVDAANANEGEDASGSGRRWLPMPITSSIRERLKNTGNKNILTTGGSTASDTPTTSRKTADFKNNAIKSAGQYRIFLKNKITLPAASPLTY